MLKRVLALVAVALLTTACASARPKTFSGEFTRPAAQSRILVMTPDIQLSVLGVAGLPEPREDWTQAARGNIANSLASYLSVKGHAPTALDPNTAMEGRTGQIIRLHDAVGRSILGINYLGASVPTRRRDFQWTLGEGVQELGRTYNADYALFVGGEGYFSSGTRMALSILTLSSTGAGQVAFASLVDLRTGHIVWFNVAQAGTTQDMRQPDGATSFVEVLMRDAPL